MDKEQQEKMEKRWKKFQENMGYSDEELAIFRSNPKYVKVTQNTKFATHKIIVEVVESHGCAAGHKAGDKFVLTAGGWLIRDECPKFMCIQALSSFMPFLFAMWERLYEDLDPNGLLFDMVHCADVGCKRGGWGEVIMKLHAVEMSKEERAKLASAK